MCSFVTNRTGDSPHNSVESEVNLNMTNIKRASLDDLEKMDIGGKVLSSNSETIEG